ncbi:DNA repair protein RecO [Robertkochia sediminum]|uniref:DNA repair protein RecO n=1 Tax=Robertkochia sediminum TaxID=2785326 RepID=UPI0019322B30|nr:DNA repair protein RecO [Robertkochia sediminum]MBL7471917.1 DNA repair protein RecO [Robertkochia sediminum]
MIEQSRAIVISALKYGDNGLIVKMLTETSGIRSYLVRGVLGSKKGKFRIGYFQPLTLLEVVATHKDKGGLEYLKEVKLLQHYRTLQTDIRKSAIVMFLSELLNGVLREEEEDVSLFTFLMTCFEWLDHHDDVANFHIAFMIQLSRYLGFYPEISGAGLPMFDLREGEFTTNTLHETITGEQLEKFKAFLVADIEESALIKMNKHQRSEMLRSLITYFQLHLQGFREPRSLNVLNEIFN